MTKYDIERETIKVKFYENCDGFIGLVNTIKNIGLRQEYWLAFVFALPTHFCVSKNLLNNSIYDQIKLCGADLIIY